MYHDVLTLLIGICSAQYLFNLDPPRRLTISVSVMMHSYYPSTENAFIKAVVAFLKFYFVGDISNCLDFFQPYIKAYLCS